MLRRLSALAIHGSRAPSRPEQAAHQVAVNTRPGPNASFSDLLGAGPDFESVRTPYLSYVEGETQKSMPFIGRGHVDDVTGMGSCGGTKSLSYVAVKIQEAYGKPSGIALENPSYPVRRSS